MKMQYDAPRLTHDEATELCVYHLRMAAALFQLVPDDNNVSLDSEIKRVCDDKCEQEPAHEWAKCIYALYARMKEDN